MASGEHVRGVNPRGTWCSRALLCVQPTSEEAGKQKILEVTGPLFQQLPWYYLGDPPASESRRMLVEMQIPGPTEA